MERGVSYVLFPNHTEATRLYGQLKEARIRCTLAPTPRSCSVCCGVSVRLERPADVPAVEQIVKENQVEIDRIVTLN